MYIWLVKEESERENIELEKSVSTHRACKRGEAVRREAASASRRED
jgi:hypothetical protein